MKQQYKFSVQYNGFCLGFIYQKYKLTGLRWAIRLGRKYQAVCQNVPLTIDIHLRPVQKRQPWDAGDFALSESYDLKIDRKLGGHVRESVQDREGREVYVENRV